MRVHRSILLLAVLALFGTLPALAQEGQPFDDNRLNQDPAAPLVVFCRFDGGLEMFSATGGGALSVSRLQIEGGLAQAVLDETAIQVAIDASGVRVVVFPDNGVLVDAPNYRFHVPPTACGGYEPDPSLTLQLVADLVGIVEGEVVAGEVVVPDEDADGSVSTSSGRTHTVRAGENLFRIGLRYGVPYPEIAAANGISNSDRIFAGQVLRIP